MAIQTLKNNTRRIKQWVVAGLALFGALFFLLSAALDKPNPVISVSTILNPLEVVAEPKPAQEQENIWRLGQ